MRRASALVIIPLLAAAAVAGCSSSSSHSSASSAASSSATTNQSVKVSGAFGASPKVIIPKVTAGTNLYTKTLITGTGPKLTAADSLVGNFVLYDWSGKTAKLVGSTYSGGGPTLFSGQMLPGLSTALLGKPTGSRVIAVIPPKDGFGTTGNSSIGVKGTDTLVFVIDMQTTISNKATAVGTQVSNGGGALPTVTEPAGQAATIKVPATAAPKALTTKTLVQGKGAKVVNGDYVVVQYTGVIWRTGKVFDSSWSRSEPFAFNVGAGQVIKGWDDGLIGQTVGSRVMLVIPPADGYGSAGASQAGIKGTDTLVFVTDILGAYTPTK
ncbi:MAG TPA: FKBP-type peptidyl-prolyl cis-trans isomerase [Trebonia sp.]|jgi:peptidylprolyl isomerase|nr:FKBP-type peptidyl-prolyl cis-trans isomerase [Trebonia sp.]